MQLVRQIFEPVDIRELVCRFGQYADGFCHGGELEHHMASFPAGYWKFLPGEVLEKGYFSSRSWFAFVQRLFWWEFTGGHPELQTSFPSFDLLRQNKGGELFGFPLAARLGAGRSAVVYEVAGGYALKVVPAGKGMELEKEYNILRRIRNRSVVKCFDIFKNSGCVAMLMEKVVSGQAMGPDYFCGLKAIHSSGFLHGDLRRANLGVSAEGIGVIFDLGRASVWSAEKAKEELASVALFGNRKVNVGMPFAFVREIRKG